MFGRTNSGDGGDGGHGDVATNGASGIVIIRNKR